MTPRKQRLEKIQEVVSSVSLTQGLCENWEVWWHSGELLVTLARNVPSKCRGKRPDCQGRWTSMTGGYKNGASKTSLLNFLQISG